MSAKCLISEWSLRPHSHIYVWGEETVGDIIVPCLAVRIIGDILLTISNLNYVFSSYQHEEAAYPRQKTIPLHGNSSEKSRPSSVAVASALPKDKHLSAIYKKEHRRA